MIAYMLRYIDGRTMVMNILDGTGQELSPTHAKVHQVLTYLA
jgi:hypothetical protein